MMMEQKKKKLDYKDLMGTDVRPEENLEKAVKVNAKLGKVL